MAPPPSPQLLVDIARLLKAGPKVRMGADRLAGLRDEMDGINRRLQASSTISQDTKLDDKINSFHSKWKDEFGIIGKTLESLAKVLEGAATTFAKLDANIGAELDRRQQKDLQKLLKP